VTAGSAAGGALAAVALSPARTVPAAVFGDSDAVTGQAVARLAALLDPRFLAGAGWDPVTWVLAPPAGHRLIRWDGARLDARAGQAGPGRRDGLLPVLGDDKCAVLACLRARRVRHHLQEAYCAVHAGRWETARRADPALDQRRWNRTAEPLPVHGQVNLRGLAPLVVAELLYGLQQRAGAECTSYCRFLRRLARELRRTQVSSLSELPVQDEPVRRSLVNSLLAHLGRAFADPRTEIAKDRWDLTVLGHHGWLAFTGISQRWLREAVKGWAAHDLPRHRGKQAGARLHEITGAMVRLSATLRAGRHDQGENPARLGRADIEAFLHRLAFLAADGQLSAYCRVKTCQDAGRVLAGIRSLGLTRPGGPAAGLADDFTLTAGDVPAKADPGEPGRDVPAEIMRQICGHLPELEQTVSSRETRIAVELLMDTGRRPAEICTLEWDCLARDADGMPVLVYDNSKAHRLRRRLPISEHTATLITDQKLAVRDRFPATPPAQLKLLPSRRLNPAGSRPVTEDNLIGRHRIWLNLIGPLLRADGTEFDKTLITPYSYRHSYAQRHADAGIPIDVLRELMDHTSMDATKRYYRVGETRRRQAVDKVTAMQFDRHGNRVWRDAATLLDSEHARYAIGAVAVPYGTCGEPSNVKAGGGACPVRFRCAGCDHFRTDVSWLPDLTGYLDDLLRTRERLAATVEGIDEWARADATPAEEEITRIRQLISKIKGDITQLTGTERAAVDDAVAIVRRHRSARSPVSLGMPPFRTPLPSPRTESRT
jgi:site-specific recombinase XerC